MSGSQRKVRRTEEPQEAQAHDAGDEDVRMRTHAGHGDEDVRMRTHAGHGDDMPNAADRGRAAGLNAGHQRHLIPGLADPMPSAEHLWAALAIPEPDEALGDRLSPPPAEKEASVENKPARKAPRFPMLLPWDEQSWSTGSNPDNEAEELTPPRPPTPMPWEEESVSTDPNLENNWAFVEDLAELEELEEPAEPMGSLALTPESQPPTPPAAARPHEDHPMQDIDTPSATPCPSPEPESPLDATAWDESETSSLGGSSYERTQSVSIGTKSVLAKVVGGGGSYPDQGERPSTSAAVRQWLRYQSETSSAASTPERPLALAIAIPTAYPALDEGPSTSAAARAWLQQQRGTTGRSIPHVSYHMPSLSPTQEDPMQPLVVMLDPDETGTLSRPLASPLPGWEEAPIHWRVRSDNRHLPHRLIQHVEGQEREGRNSHRSFLYGALGILFRVRFNKRNEVTISLRSPK